MIIRETVFYLTIGKNGNDVGSSRGMSSRSNGRQRDCLQRRPSFSNRRRRDDSEECEELRPNNSGAGSSRETGRIEPKGTEDTAVASRRPCSKAEMRDSVTCFRSVLRLHRKRQQPQPLCTMARVALGMAISACDNALVTLGQKNADKGKNRASAAGQESSEAEIMYMIDSFSDASCALLRYYDPLLACDAQLLLADVLRTLHRDVEAAEALEDCAGNVQPILPLTESSKESQSFSPALSHPHAQALYRALLIEASRLFENASRFDRALAIEQTLVFDARQQLLNAGSSGGGDVCGARAERALEAHIGNVERLQQRICANVRKAEQRRLLNRSTKNQPQQQHARSWADMNDDESIDDDDVTINFWLENIVFDKKSI